MSSLQSSGKEKDCERFLFLVFFCWTERFDSGRYLSENAGILISVCVLLEHEYLSYLSDNVSGYFRRENSTNVLNCI